MRLGKPCVWLLNEKVQAHSQLKMEYSLIQLADLANLGLIDMIAHHQHMVDTETQTCG